MLQRCNIVMQYFQCNGFKLIVRILFYIFDMMNTVHYLQWTDRFPHFVFIITFQLMYFPAFIICSDGILNPALYLINTVLISKAGYWCYFSADIIFMLIIFSKSLPGIELTIEFRIWALVTCYIPLSYMLVVNYRVKYRVYKPSILSFLNTGCHVTCISALDLLSKILYTRICATSFNFLLVPSAQEWSCGK